MPGQVPGSHGTYTQGPLSDGTNAPTWNSPPGVNGSRFVVAVSTPTATVRRTSYPVQIAALSDENQQRLYNFIQTFNGFLVGAPNWKVVYVNGKNGAYWRRVPGAAQLEKALGAEFFDLLGALVGVGVQAYDDSRRNDLNGSQKLGRASVALLTGAATALGGPVAVLAWAWIGATILFPSQTDAFTKALFADEDPIVGKLSSWIAAYGG